jgi:predicted nicotinamide N-methyase
VGVFTAGGGITRDLVFPLNLAFPSSSLSTITNNPLSSSSSSGVPSSTSTDSITLKIYDAALSDHTSVGVQTWGSAILLGRIFALDPWRWLFNHLGTEEMKVAAAADIPGASVGGLEGDRTEVIRGPRVLELGAGTGVMAILIRRILDEIKRCDSSSSPDDSDQGSLVGTISRQPVRLVGDEVLATDYHPLVLDNLEKCIRLNFSPSVADQGEEAAVGVPGLETMLLDWSTFPGIVRRWAEGSFFDGMKQQGLEPKDGPSGDWTLPTSLVTPGDVESETPLLTDQVKDVLDTTWDLIIAADCVYDLSHAEMIRDVVKWTLRLPEVDETGEIIRPGGVLVSLVAALDGQCLTR